MKKLTPKLAYKVLSEMDPKDITLFRRDIYGSKYSFVGYLLEKALGYDHSRRFHVSFEEGNRILEEYRQIIKSDPILIKLEEIHEKMILPFRTITLEYKKYVLEEALKAIKDLEK